MPIAKRALRSNCPISGMLDLVGDRWSLLLIRDLLEGPCRYGDFVGADEGIPTNILADRLVRLEDAGVITSEPYQDNPPRYTYSLTDKGRDLKPVLTAMVAWGHQHVRGTKLRSALTELLS